MTRLAANSVEGRAQTYVERIERLVGEIESARGTYMAEAKSLREDIKEIKGEAKENGVLVKSLNAIIEERRLQRKIAALSATLDIDEAAQFSRLSEAIGGPMGEWAQRRAAGNSATDDDKRDLRGDQRKQTEKERADAEALAKVGRGPQAAATH